MQIPLLFFVCLVVIGWDLVARRVPNPFLIVCAAMQCALTASSPYATGWWQAFTGFLLAVACLLPFYALRMMGAGDVKFGALLGMMTGPSVFLAAWVVGSLLAGLHSVVILRLRANPELAGLVPVARGAYGRLEQRVSVGNRYRLSERITALRQGRNGLPYAAYLAFGALTGWWSLLHLR